MTKRRWPWVVLVLSVAAALVAWLEPSGTVRGYLRGEPTFDGKPTTAWANSLRDANPATREAARRQLANGGPGTIPVLADLLRLRPSDDWSSADRRVTAAEILKDKGVKAAPAAPTLVAALDDSDANVRAAAAEALGEIGPAAQECYPGLLAHLNRGVPAIRALARFGTEARKAEGEFITRLSDADDAVRWNAARALGKIQAGPAGVEALARALTDKDAEVREHAAEALGDIGPTAAAAVAALTTALKDENYKVRRDAADALGKIGPDAKSAADALRKLADDPEKSVREAADRSLKKLAG
jgi:HEAT repeat protein